VVLIHAGLFQQSAQGVELVAPALHHQVDAQVAHAVGDHLRGAPGEDAHLHAAVHQHAHAVPVLGVEGLVLLAAVAQKQAAVGEYAVHVEQDETDVFGELRSGHCHGVRVTEGRLTGRRQEAKAGTPCHFAS
jgi:hypothetical protein